LKIENKQLNTSMEQKEKIINIPNLLSFYRLLAIPFIIWSCIDHHRTLFIILISINLITDILDGLIARAFNMCTEFGAKLDSVADIGTFLLAVLGFFVFEYQFMLDHYFAFFILLALYIIGQWFSIIKFKQTTSFHLYSNKFSGYVQGIFVITFFIYGYNSWYFYFMILVGCLAEIEVILLVLLLPKKISNVKSIFLI
jgi:cardiolipin synthase (CMP-forming)